MLMKENRPRDQISLEDPGFKNVKHSFHCGPAESLQWVHACWDFPRSGWRV